MDETRSPVIPNHEPEGVQRGAQVRRFATHLARPDKEPARLGKGQARAQSDFQLPNSSILSEHQVLVQFAVASGHGDDGEPTAPRRFGLACAGLKHGKPAAKDGAGYHRSRTDYNRPASASGQ